MRTLSAAAVQQLGVSSSQRLSRSDSGSAPKATQDNGWSPKPRLRPPFRSRRTTDRPRILFLASRAHQSPRAKSKASQRGPTGMRNRRRRGATLRLERRRPHFTCFASRQSAEGKRANAEPDGGDPCCHLSGNKSLVRVDRRDHFQGLRPSMVAHNPGPDAGGIRQFINANQRSCWSTFHRNGFQSTAPAPDKCRNYRRSPMPPSPGR